jgi:subtilisin-like proprotein convertase family protein
MPDLSLRKFAFAAILLGNLLLGQLLPAQSGLRQSLERLDRNENGKIDPDEVTPLARPYLERLMRVRSGRYGLSMNQSNDIEKLQQAARAYYADANGSNDDRVRPKGNQTVKTFGTEEDQPLIPEFGLPRVRYAYTQDDLDFADRTLRSHDENKDGYIDRDEATRHEWTHRQPFADDLNNDDRLSRLEMAQRYARRRLLSAASGELIKKAWRGGSEIRPTTASLSRRSYDRDRYDLSATMFQRFDTNKNGRLEADEADKVGIAPGKIDLDRDGELTRAELDSYFKELQEIEGDAAASIPEWFFEMDTNRDGQVEMFEYATDWTNEKLDEFASFDVNEDGILTTEEVSAADSSIGAESFRNQKAVVLAPRKTIISEIEIDEDLLIADLNVQLSITHTNVSYLDAFLSGPDGQRIELFSEVGGRDNHFDGTIFDDQAEVPITKASPPYQGTFSPEAVLKGQPSLSQYNGKSAKGVWQLIVAGRRNDRFGMLHSWVLIIKPMEQRLTDE